MIIDCFPFCNELELLEIRMEELKGVVDWFVLVEALETYSGKSKELVYAANKDRFVDFNICSVQINAFPASLRSPWEREAFTRNALAGALNALHVCADDIILLSDADEIPRAEQVIFCAEQLTHDPTGCKVFEQDLSCCFFNCRSSHIWHGTRMIRYGSLTTLQELHSRTGEAIQSGGWHFSYLGDKEQIRGKVEAAPYTELDLHELTSAAYREQYLISGADPLRQDTLFQFVPLDAGFPQFLLTHRKRFASLIAPSNNPVPEEKAEEKQVSVPEMKLDIGSGGKSDLGPDWLGVDAYVATADIQAQMWELPMVSGSVAAIFSSHALEHVSMKQIQPTLQEWHRVLKPGGVLTLRVPDLAWCMEQWLQRPTFGFEMMRIFGNQGHDGEFHKCGFTTGLLHQALTSAGFEIQSIDPVWSHAQQTLSAEARKPT